MPTAVWPRFRWCMCWSAWMTEPSPAETAPQESCLDLRLHYRHGWGQLAPYFSALKRGQLLGRRCSACSKLSIPPRRQCSCGSTALQWESHTGWGWVKSVTQATGQAPGQELRRRTFVLVQFDGVPALSLAELEGEEPGSPPDRVKVAACAPGAGRPPTLCVRAEPFSNPLSDFICR